MFSASNLKQLRAAYSALRSLFTAANLPEVDEDEAEDTDAKEAALSHSDLSARLTKALKKSGLSASSYPYIRDCFPTFFVYQSDYGSDLQAVEYTVDEKGAVTLGTTTSVISRTSYEKLDGTPFAEALLTPCETEELTPLLEAALSEAATREIKLITPGKGSSGYYPTSVLKRDGPNVFKKGLKMYWDHQTAKEEAEKPEGSLSRLAGVLESDAEWKADHPHGAGLYAKAKVFSAYESTLSELAPHIGVSIRANGKAKVGEVQGLGKLPIIEEITSARSVDFVTTPGAGGKVLELFEAAKTRGATPPTADDITLVEANTGGDEVGNEEQVTQLTEQLRQTNTEVARLREAIAAQRAAAVIAAELRTVRLPQATKDRLAGSLVHSGKLTEAGTLDETALKAEVAAAVAAEAQYLSSLGVGSVKGMGAAKLEEADPEKLEAEVDALIASL